MHFLESASRTFQVRSRDCGEVKRWSKGSRGESRFNFPSSKARDTCLNHSRDARDTVSIDVKPSKTPHKEFLEFPDIPRFGSDGRKVPTLVRHSVLRPALQHTLSRWSKCQTPLESHTARGILTQQSDAAGAPRALAELARPSWISYRLRVLLWIFPESVRQSKGESSSQLSRVTPKRTRVEVFRVEKVQRVLRLRRRHRLQTSDSGDLSFVNRKIVSLSFPLRSDRANRLSSREVQSPRPLHPLFNTQRNPK